MAQLRRDYEKFIQRGVEILVVGPEGEGEFRLHWEEGEFPFVGIPDPYQKIANLYRQKVKLLKMGRMPAQVIVDKNGFIRFQHFGNSMRDISSNQYVLELIDQLNEQATIEQSAQF